MAVSENNNSWKIIQDTDLILLLLVYLKRTLHPLEPWGGAKEKPKQIFFRKYSIFAVINHHLAKEKSQVFNAHPVVSLRHLTQVHGQHLKDVANHWAGDLVQHHLGG